MIALCCRIGRAHADRTGDGPRRVVLSEFGQPPSYAVPGDLRLLRPLAAALQIEEMFSAECFARSRVDKAETGQLSI